MILIKDYRNLPVLSGQSPLSMLLGRDATVFTAAGTFSGIVVGSGPETLTLAFARRTRGGQENRKMTIAKKHIIAIETRLD